MARLESVTYVPHRSEVIDASIKWLPTQLGSTIQDLPQVFWSTGIPWREANLWLMFQATSKNVDIRTVHNKAFCLHAYAQWLEQTKTNWWDFPWRESDRCLFRFRKFLIHSRNSSTIAPSTASQRIRVAVQFYRWLSSTKLISTDWPMWKERTIGIHFNDTFGFDRTLLVSTTDLAIPNRRAVGIRLEDGLIPVSARTRDSILNFAKAHASEELFLLLTCGFFTGMRIQTLADLRIETLERAIPDPAHPELLRLTVGPGASPPVKTKFDVTGQIWISKVLLDRLWLYATSVRRLKRVAKASNENKNLLFLTRFGNPYAQRGTDKSTAINVEMLGLRRTIYANNSKLLEGFKFHQTRCTFATQLARLAIANGGGISAIAIVKEALLHKDEATSLKYIKFVESTDLKSTIMDEFTRAFLGITDSSSSHEK
ncbi:site-specific integrase [Stutzerimonas stutzeri]|uniref:site-specific integrase n=1 Tax=Stutzerimonas stutzeri TaxID=316 RepID=UPI0009C01EC1|nr:site-specific integrase [Stutzerimonas stutzeri]MCQ4284810.1 site-specific integrase [Stutzerimonas stutzeri]